jgi:hypothetical protein
LGDNKFLTRAMNLENTLHNYEQRERVKEIKQRYVVINESCTVFLSDTLKRAAKRHKLLKVSEIGSDIRNFVTRYFSSFGNSVARLGAVGTGILNLVKAVSTLADDLVKAFPKVASAGAMAVAGVTAVGISGYAAAYMYLMFTEITMILIEDAKFIYLENQN